MNGSTTLELARLMSAAAESLNVPHTLDERLEAVVRAATSTVPGFDHASVSVAYRDKVVKTRAASSDVVLKLDLHQYEMQQGPCVEAMAARGVVVAPVLRHEQRWEQYTARAVEAGIKAQMALHLGGRGPTRGALNLYSTTREEIEPEALGIASLFATHAALSLGWGRTEDQLTEALTTRKLIGQAIGIVMERYQISEEKAFAFLTRVSSTGNIKLRAVAQELVSQSDARYSSKESE